MIIFHFSNDSRKAMRTMKKYHSTKPTIKRNGANSKRKRKVPLDILLTPPCNCGMMDFPAKKAKARREGRGMANLTGKAKGVAR